ncbi:MAG: hypothetical protein IKE58_12460 [Blautia sp.]|nr:hypothetical protein [Blautia sp.]
MEKWISRCLTVTAQAEKVLAFFRQLQYSHITINGDRLYLRSICIVCARIYYILRGKGASGLTTPEAPFFHGRAAVRDGGEDGKSK